MRTCVCGNGMWCAAGGDSPCRPSCRPPCRPTPTPTPLRRRNTSIGTPAPPPVLVHGGNKNKQTGFIQCRAQGSFFYFSWGGFRGVLFGELFGHGDEGVADGGDNLTRWIGQTIGLQVPISYSHSTVTAQSQHSHSTATAQPQHSHCIAQPQHSHSTATVTEGEAGMQSDCKCQAAAMHDM